MAWIILSIVLGACMLLGGSARADSIQLLVLRPVLVGCLALSLVAFPLRSWVAEQRSLAMLLLAFAVLMLVQLIPLPGLAPGRQAACAALNAAASRIDCLSYIDLTPDRGWNALLALLPVSAAMLAQAALAEEDREAGIAMIVGVAFLSGVFGLVQLSQGADSPLYYYAFSHRGLPIGFLANRNHQAAVLASALPLLRALALSGRFDNRRLPSLLTGMLSVPIVLLLLTIILVTGSRSGLALAVLGGAAAFMIRPRSPFGNMPSQWRVGLAAAAVALTGGVLTAAIMFGRALSVDRLLASNIADSEERIANAPTVLRIIQDHLWTGTGFGAFDTSYRKYEPDAALHLSYFNNAHNDVLELLMNGGILAALLLAAFLGWFMRRAWIAFFRADDGPSAYVARACAASASLFLLASLTDYPLRTPLVSAIFGILCVTLSQTTAGEARLSVSTVARPRRTGYPGDPGSSGSKNQ